MATGEDKSGKSKKPVRSYPSTFFEGTWKHRLRKRRTSPEAITVSTGNSTLANREPHFFSCLNNITDPGLRELFCLDVPFFHLLKRYTTADFLRLNPNKTIPFFAEIRNYQGATEKSGASWIVRCIPEEKLIQTATGTIVYFLDRFTGTPSAPTILTIINGKRYLATKLISKADQLSGANYTVEKHLKEQLALDLINRWIFADEDRNPNNYLIKTDSKNLQLVVPIDFGNADLTSEAIKIKGTSRKFGWSRKEKTQYLTPLKMKMFTDFDMAFYQQRFEQFQKIDARLLKTICRFVFKLCPQSIDTEQITATITRNILRRIHYVHTYFEKHIPQQIVKTDRYSGMGQAFLKISQGDR